MGITDSVREGLMLNQLMCDHYVAKGLWGDSVLTDSLQRNAELHPEKEAIVDCRSRVTFSELVQKVDRLALGFHEVGIKRGDIICLQLPNWLEVFYFVYALSKIGAVPCFINLRFRREVGLLMGFTEAVGVAVSAEYGDFSFVQMIKDATNALPDLRHVFVLGEPILEGMISFDDFVNTKWEDKYNDNYLASLRPNANDILALITTSGTEGSPKLVMHTHNTVLHYFSSINKVVKLAEDDVFLTMAPLTGAAMGGITSLWPLHFGAKLVIQEKFNSPEALELIERHGVTRIQGVASHYIDMLEALKSRRYDLSSVRVATITGAPIASELANRVVSEMGCKVNSRYGMSEDWNHTTTRLDDSLKVVCETVGKCSPGMELKIVDDNLRDVPNEEIGQILARGPNLFVGYYKNPEETKSTRTEDGWFMTGDLGFIGEDGNLRVKGRIKDLIIRGGLKINTKEVEDLLCAHPKILRAAVVAMPDERLGERSCAFVVPREDQVPDFDEIVSFLKKKGIAIFKIPDRLEVISEMPMTASMKIKKVDLRERIIQLLKEEKHNGDG